MGTPGIPGEPIEVRAEDYQGSANPREVEINFDIERGDYYAYFALNNRYYLVRGETESKVSDKMKQFSATRATSSKSGKAALGKIIEDLQRVQQTMGGGYKKRKSRKTRKLRKNRRS
jgi:hypothetical protein